MAYKRISTQPIVEGGTGANSLTGVVTGNGTSALTANAVTQYSPVIGGASNAVASVAVGTSGQALQSSGAGVAADYTTATYPATTTVSQLLYSSSANTSAGLATANNGVVITSATGVPSVLAAGTTGQVLTATTGSPPSWAAAGGGGGGGWTFISSATASTSATLDFTSDIDSTYTVYAFVMENIVPATDNVIFELRTSTDAGSTWDSGSSDYRWTGTTSVDTVGSYIKINTQSFGQGSATNENAYGTVYLYSPSDTTYTYINFDYSYIADTGSNVRNFGSGQRSSAADVTGIRFLYSSGTIESGTISLYGVCTPS